MRNVGRKQLKKKSEMKSVNLISLVQAYNNIHKPTYAKYLKYLKVNPKDHEVDDLASLTEELLLIDEDIKGYNNFFFGYSIPQIGKEFDLLRFGESSIINIELKRTSDEEKIEKQLLRNKYYLGFLGLEILSYTYISSTKKLYSIDYTNKLIEVYIEELFDALVTQKVVEVSDIDILFNPSSYLVSPFNSTANFINGDYFLTVQQENVKKQVITSIEKKGTTFIAISGKAGTGKSILTYDIAKEYINQKIKVLIIHCGLLNEGHLILKDIYGWDVIPAKNIYRCDLSKYFLIIIDETQRIYPNQLEHIIKDVKSRNSNCLFSYDKQQCLRSWEVNNKIEDSITKDTSAIKFELTDKIRTNKEIASFIRCLFNKSSAIHAYERKNVELNYFSNYVDAKEFMIHLQSNDWKIINYTPSTKFNYPYDNVKIHFEDTTHEVIGQEFDNVVAVIDSHFYYDGDVLSTKNFKHQPYYHPTKMLFQIVTRTRKKLNLIIIDNDEIMERCLNILN